MNRFALAALAFGMVGCQMVDHVAKAVGNPKVALTLKNGEKIEGTLLQQGDGKSTVQVKYGTVTLTASDVVSVEKHGEAVEAEAGTGRLARWDRCMEVAAGRPWARGLVQIPATVVDTGILKNVPYISHRAGDFEFNIYGDPDAPAGLEVGIYGIVNNVAARKACLETMLALLNDSKDREALRALNLETGKAMRAGMTFEVTPPTAPDAYGGWWISIYDEKMLAEQRATDRELPRITTTREQIKSVKTPGSVIRWKEQELKLARPEAPAAPANGRVYLRGVHRKDGIYVAPSMT